MKHKILGLLAVGLLAGSTGAHAVSLIGDSVGCSFTGGLGTCASPSATVGLGTEFAINAEGFPFPVLFIDVRDSFVIFTSPTGFRFDSDTFVLSDLDFSGAPGGITGLVLDNFDGISGLNASKLSFTPDSLTVLFQSVTFFPVTSFTIDFLTGRQSVPEPGALALLGLGLLGLGFTRRKAH